MADRGAVTTVLTLSMLSLEYVRVRVSATVAGSPVNPTGDPVQMAFITPGAVPGPGDWNTAGWDTAPTGGVYTAQCLIGPGGTITLPAGVYAVWVKITDNPEIPVRQAGAIRLT